MGNGNGSALVALANRLPSLGKKISSKDLKIERIAQKEIAFWKGKYEGSSGAYDRLALYWKPFSGFAWTPSSVPWSGVFVDYILRDYGFPGDPLHYNYVMAGTSTKSKWRTIGIESNRGKIKIAVGDVLVAPREGSDQSSHGDVVYAIDKNTAYLVGGNVGDTVAVKTVGLDKDGILIDPKRYLVVLKYKLSLGWGMFTKFAVWGGLATAIGLTADALLDLSEEKE